MTRVDGKTKPADPYPLKVLCLDCKGHCPNCGQAADTVYSLCCTCPWCDLQEVCCPACASPAARDVLDRREEWWREGGDEPPGSLVKIG